LPAISGLHHAAGSFSQSLLASCPVVHQALTAAEAASMSSSASASSSSSSSSSSAYNPPSSAAMGSLDQQLVAAYSSFAEADAQQLRASTAAVHMLPPQKLHLR